MKIGIMTFHFGINYGGVLQCYALQTFLEKQGHVVEIINFIPPKFEYSVWWKGNGYRKSLILGMKRACVKLCYAGLQREKFENFRKKHLKISKDYSIDNLSSITDEYSAIIVGSDQVWNMSQRYHGAYFLSPFVNFKGKRISYAPCCARNIVDEEQVPLLKKSLQKFNMISVRNIETQNFVSNLTGEKPEIVVDPTLLIDFNFDFRNENIPENNYILVYIIGDEIKGGHFAIISEIKKKYGNLRVYAIILSHNHPHFFSWADKSYWDIGPLEWITLIENATFVYTDSFHGLLFAMKYKKPFLAYYAENKRSSRFIDLMARYKLESFIVNSVADSLQKKSFDKKPDYREVESVLFTEVQKSISFIEKALADRM
jgi:hypothetical protein